MPESLRIEVSHSDCAPPPIVPGADSSMFVRKSAVPAPTTCVPPPTVTLPVGHSALSRTNGDAACAGPAAAAAATTALQPAISTPLTRR